MNNRNQPIDLKTENNHHIDRKSIFSKSIRYKIRNDYSISKYSDLEILEVIKKYLETHEKGIFKIIEKTLYYQNNNKKSYFFHPFNPDLYTTDNAEIRVYFDGDKRKVEILYSTKRISIYTFKGLTFLFIFSTIMQIAMKSLYSFIITTIFIFSFGLLGYFVMTFKHYSMIKRILFREELRINNEL